MQRFTKSDDVLFFEAHKDEEWFQERYDPIIIEKSSYEHKEFVAVENVAVKMGDSELRMSKHWKGQPWREAPH